MANGVMAAALANDGSDGRTPGRCLTACAATGPSGQSGWRVLLLARGDMDSAVEWAGKSADQRIASLVTLMIRAFEPRLITSAGWPALLKRLNLTPAVTTTTS